MWKWIKTLVVILYVAGFLYQAHDFQKAVVGVRIVLASMMQLERLFPKPDQEPAIIGVRG